MAMWIEGDGFTPQILCVPVLRATSLLGLCIPPALAKRGNIIFISPVCLFFYLSVGTLTVQQDQDHQQKEGQRGQGHQSQGHRQRSR